MATIEGLKQSFLEYHQAMGHSEATVRHYADSINLLLRCMDDEGIEPVADSLTGQTFITFAGWLRSTPTRVWRGKTERSVWGVHGALKDCKAWVRWLADQELIAKAPKIPIPRLPQTLFPILTEEDLELIFNCSQLAAHSEISIRNRAVFAFLIDTGVRLSEAAGLQMEDLDLKEGSAKITGKGNKQRIVYFSKGATDALRRWVAVRGDEEGQVFWLETTGIRMLLGRIKRETGLPMLHCHQLRHTALTMMVKAGADLHTVKRIAGHASVTTTEAYLALAGADMKVKHTSASPFDAINQRAKPPKQERRRLRTA